jgi:hypothetical protein
MAAIEREDGGEKESHTFAHTTYNGATMAKEREDIDKEDVTDLRAIIL